MTPAAAAEYNANIGHDFSLLDAMTDEEFLDAPDATEDEAERQRVNQAMFDYFYG